MKSNYLFIIAILALPICRDLRAQDNEDCPASSSLTLQKTASLDLKETEIANVFSILAQTTSYNVVAINVPRRKITALLKDKSYKEIIEHIAKQNQLSFSTNGNVITFFKDSDPARYKVPSTKKYRGKCISLDLLETRLSNAVKILESVSGKKIKNIPAENLNKKVTLKLIDVPWQQALDAVLLHVGLEGNFSGTDIFAH